MGYIDAPKDDISNPIYKGGLKTVHRLDRQTSGIVFFAKSEVPKLPKKTGKKKKER